MNKDELYEILDIESGKDFQYFENIAELFESDQDIGGDIVYELLEDIDFDTFGELIEGYFNQIQEWIPDNETDFYTLMSNIERVLVGLVQRTIDTEDDEDEDDLMMQLSEEIGKFREWYSDSDNVECKDLDTEDVHILPVRDALALSRETHYGDKNYEFDFGEALHYEIDEYVMSIADLMDNE